MQRQRCEQQPEEDEGQRRHMMDGDAGKEEGAAPDQAELDQQTPGPGIHSAVHADCSTASCSFCRKSAPVSA
ncbi:hypothetical protein [Rhizobium leguminosarum]